MESLNSPNIFLSKPFKYTKRDEKDREVEVPASSAPEILSQATKKHKMCLLRIEAEVACGFSIESLKRYTITLSLI